MSSDGYFDGDDFDEEALTQLDAIEAAHFSPTRKLSPILGPSQFNRSTSCNKLQTTLFGEIVKPGLSYTTANTKSTAVERTKSVPRNPFGQQAPKTKKWDQTAFAKSGKGKGRHADDDEGGGDAVEFEQFPNPLPPPFVPSESLGIHLLPAQV
jgi:ATP-dependent DNA helicase MPH1